MESLYVYPVALAIISVVVAGLEAMFPKRKDQGQLRRSLGSDVVHLVFNGHFLGVIIYGLAVNFVVPVLDGWLAQMGWMDVVYRNAAQAWPVWVQIVVVLVVMDFIQWCVHNLLHRVPWLWELHKTHHSVQDGEMDWMVSFRFQWTEVVVYKAIQYLPLAFFGFGAEAVMFHAIFGTFIGHLNHANLDWDWGPLKYVLNSPNMHIWHHDYEGGAQTTVNFGIIFSSWDWLFGTAKLPNQSPEKLGFEGVEAFPTHFFSQAVWPLQSWVPALRSRQALASGLGVLLIGALWVLHKPLPQMAQVPASVQGEALTASPLLEATEGPCVGPQQGPCCGTEVYGPRRNLYEGVQPPNVQGWCGCTGLYPGVCSDAQPMDSRKNERPSSCP
ncbi:MAG: sterol desaturase family protein [Myxococcota bacterium]